MLSWECRTMERSSSSTKAITRTSWFSPVCWDREQGVLLALQVGLPSKATLLSMEDLWSPHSMTKAMKGGEARQAWAQHLKGLTISQIMPHRIMKPCSIKAKEVTKRVRQQARDILKTRSSSISSITSLVRSRTLPTRSRFINTLGDHNRLMGIWKSPSGIAILGINNSRSLPSNNDPKVLSTLMQTISILSPIQTPKLALLSLSDWNRNHGNTENHQWDLNRRESSNSWDPFTIMVAVWLAQRKTSQTSRYRSLRVLLVMFQRLETWKTFSSLNL